MTDVHFLRLFHSTIEEKLVKYNFCSKRLVNEGSSRIMVDFERNISWCSHAVEFLVKREQRMLIYARVRVRLAGAADEDVLDGTSLETAIGNDAAGPYEPPTGLFADLRLKQFVSKISERAELGVTWFRHYSSPGSALRRLASGAANGAMKGTTKYRSQIELLQSLADRKNSE